MSQGTRCHQLAAYVVHDSPLTMLADNPTIYKREQECTDFIISIPNKGIEETRVLQGKVGESIIMALQGWYFLVYRRNDRLDCPRNYSRL